MVEEKSARNAKDGSYKTQRVKDATVLHMGVYDIEAANEIRKAVHDSFLRSHNDIGALVSCFEALDQLWTIVKPPCAKGTRKGVEEEFVKMRKHIQDLEDLYTATGGKIAHKEYRPIREQVRKLIDKVYFVKQVVGLGIPVERTRDAEALLDEAMRT